MRLVDREQRHLGAFQLAEEAPGQQPLRRHVEQIQFTGQQLSFDLALLFGAEAGVEIRSRHTGFTQRVDLILHQRDQRRHHDAGALAQQRGDLIAQ